MPSRSSTESVGMITLYKSDAGTPGRTLSSFVFTTHVLFYHIIYHIAQKKIPSDGQVNV